MKFNSIKITNYKSIDTLSLEGLGFFSVFAGPNGCGKSNFFDAIDFISLFTRSGLQDALRQHGGYENIHSVKRRKENARAIEFQMELPAMGNSSAIKYHLKINALDSALPNIPQIEESFWADDKKIIDRKGSSLTVEGNKLAANFSQDYSALLFVLDSNIHFVQALKDIRLYRIDPLGAKEPDKSDQDPSALNRLGHNLATVLKKVENNPSVSDTILQWISTIVPGIEKITPERQKLDGKTALLFKEEGTRRLFPAHLVSDGTIYALNLLVAVLDKPSSPSWILIEEPERGLHPQAIRSLVDLIRDQVTEDHPIWMTTHNESVIRQLSPSELWLVNKQDGRTKMKLAADTLPAGKLSSKLPMDEAWLANVFDGGLPW